MFRCKPDGSKVVEYVRWVMVHKRDEAAYHDEVGGYYEVFHSLAPVIPMEQMQKTVWLTQGQQTGAVTMRRLREDGYGIEDPDQEDREVWIEKLEQGPVFQNAVNAAFMEDVKLEMGQSSAGGTTQSTMAIQQALMAVGHPEGADRSHHFSYEMVALSHATARELGYAPPPASEDAKRPFVEVSGRKGLGVKADDLLDTLIRSAGTEVGTRNPELSEEERRRIAEIIAIAAVRYFMIKFSRGKVIAFDLAEALSFEGESGPYIQYAVVRANNIFQKLQQRDGLNEAALLKALRDVPSGELDGANGSHELWSLVLDAARLDEIVEQVIRSLEFSVLAKYAFTLAQSFNAFYHRAPILNEERDDVRRWRAAAVIYLRNQLRTALDLMGVDVPPRM